jgi:predicted PurR-regulated permease PerM
VTTPSRVSRGNAIALWIIAVVASLFFLQAASQLLIPIVLAVLISFALEPAVAWLERHRVPRVAGAALVLLGILGLCAWGLYSLRDDAQQAIEALPKAAQRAQELVTKFTGGSGYGGSGNGGSGDGAVQGGPGGQAQAENGGQPQGGGGGAGGGSAMLGLIQRGVGSVMALLGHIVVIFFLVYFLLMSGHHVRNRLVEISGPEPSRRRLAAQIVDEIDAQVQRFLVVRLITGAVVGVATWAVLGWMGVQNAAVWGILAGVFNSIPYFGPVIVSGGLFVLGIVQEGDLTRALQMSGAALVITSLEGWVLEPPLMGKAERMSALSIFIGLLVWTWVWGAWGTLLAVPMLVVLKSVADRIEPMKPIGRLMAP